MDYLLRDDAPFESELWDRIDSLVVKTAKQQLVGRRFLHLYGPLGAGIQSINMDRLVYDHNVSMDLLGADEAPMIKPQSRVFVSIPMIYKDFFISWRDLEAQRQTGLPVDIGAASAAAYALSAREDSLIFYGSQETEGLLNAQGRQVVKKSDWRQGDNPFLDVAAGIEKLVAQGIYEPYALVASPDMYLKMQRLQQGTGLLLIDRIRELVGGRVYQSPVIEKDKAVLVACSSQYMDLVIGQDMITGYTGPDQMNHTFRVFETVLFRLKQPAAVVTFE